jgi:hypothetical protein
MKLKAIVLRLSIALMPFFALPGCPLGNTDDIVNAEYYGSNSFRLAYTGMWEDNDTFQGLGVHSNATNAAYTITEAKPVEGSSFYATKYAILYVDSDWTPGDTITVSHYAAGKQYSFNVPKEDS